MIDPAGISPASPAVTLTLATAVLSRKLVSGIEQPSRHLYKFDDEHATFVWEVSLISIKISYIDTAHFCMQ